MTVGMRECVICGDIAPQLNSDSWENAHAFVTSSAHLATSSYGVWMNDYSRIHAALAPWAFEVDGDTFLDPAAPESLTRPYAALQSMGYANGWL